MLTFWTALFWSAFTVAALRLTIHFAHFGVYHLVALPVLYALVVGALIGSALARH